MKITEFEKVKDMTYYGYCDYLQRKYGPALVDYMTKSFNKNRKISRTSEGLVAHHKAEDKMILLSTKSIAEQCPYEWQKKENIIYCDYLEHLLLHVLICKYPSTDRWQGIEVGVGGVVNFIVPELNDLYSGWITKQAWRIKCHEMVVSDKKVYLEILKIFVSYLQNQRKYNDKTILHISLNENFGLWSGENNVKLYTELDKLWQ